MDHRQHTATGQKWERGGDWSWVSVMCWWGWRCGECTTSVTNSVWIDRWIDWLDLCRPPVGMADSLTTGSSSQGSLSCICSFIKCVYILNPPLIIFTQAWKSSDTTLFLLYTSFLTASGHFCLSRAHIYIQMVLMAKTGKIKRLIRTWMFSLCSWIQYVAQSGLHSRFVHGLDLSAPPSGPDGIVHN